MLTASSDVHLVVAALEELVTVKRLGHVVSKHCRSGREKYLDLSFEELVTRKVNPGIATCL